MNKKRNLILYTGGTIGMKPSKKGLIPEKGYLTSKIDELLKDELSSTTMPNVDVIEYERLIDSSDVSIETINRIANDIASRIENYDSFLVLHGTDTMAYTSSALSFMLNSLNKPVIVTGSQLPFSDFRSDGRNNLFHALFIANNFDINEVCLFFNDKLHRGNRVTKISTEGFDAFASPNASSIVDVGVNIKLNQSYKPLSVGQTFQLKTLKQNDVDVIFLHPGYNNHNFRKFINDPPSAIVLFSFGVGNIPTTQSFLDSLEQLIKKDVKIVNCSQCPKGSMSMGTYEGGFILKNMGVLDSYDMTKEAVIMKLLRLLSDGSENFDSRWKENIVREFS